MLFKKGTSEHYIPSSHWLPLNPGIHEQLYESTPSVHVAPFLHGPLAQWSTSVRGGGGGRERERNTLQHISAEASKGEGMRERTRRAGRSRVTGRAGTRENRIISRRDTRTAILARCACARHDRRVHATVKRSSGARPTLRISK